MQTLFRKRNTNVESVEMILGRCDAFHLDSSLQNLVKLFSQLLAQALHVHLHKGKPRFREDMTRMALHNGLEMDWEQESYRDYYDGNSSEDSLRTTMMKRKANSKANTHGSKGFKGFGEKSLGLAKQEKKNSGRKIVREDSQAVGLGKNQPGERPGKDATLSQRLQFMVDQMDFTKKKENQNKRVN
jgi:hypothetical protein